MRYLWQFLGWLMGLVMILWIVDLCWISNFTAQLPGTLDTRTPLGTIPTPALTWIGLFTAIFVFLQTKMGDTRPEGDRWFLIDVGIPLAIIAAALTVVFSWAGNDLFAFIGLPTPSKTPTATDAVYLFGFAATLEFLNTLLRSFRRTHGARPIRTAASSDVGPADETHGGARVHDLPLGHIRPYYTYEPPSARLIDNPGDDDFIVHGTARLVPSSGGAPNDTDAHAPGDGK